MGAVAIVCMTEEEAKDAVKQINSWANDCKAKIVDLYERSGWKALGYKNWSECVKQEFTQISKSTVYRALEHTKKTLPRSRKLKRKPPKVTHSQSGTVAQQLTTDERVNRVFASTAAATSNGVIRNAGNAEHDPEPEPAPVTDCDGESVPKNLVASFAIRAELDEVIKELRRKENRIYQLCREPGGDALAQHCRVFRKGDDGEATERFKFESLRNAISFLRDLQPAKPCPRCKGKGCDDCLKRGWVDGNYWRDHKRAK